MSVAKEAGARPAVVDCRSEGWLEQTLENLRILGYGVVEGALDEVLIQETREAMYAAQQAIRADVAEDRLERAGELGVLRLMLAYNDHFFRFLELRAGARGRGCDRHGHGDPALAERVDSAVVRCWRDARTSSSSATTATFRAILNGYLMSVNTFFAIDEFRQDNGATIVVPATHQREPAPSEELLNANAMPVECPAGSMIVFDSTLLHAAGENVPVVTGSRSTSSSPAPT